MLGQTYYIMFDNILNIECIKYVKFFKATLSRQVAM